MVVECTATASGGSERRRQAESAQENCSEERGSKGELWLGGASGEDTCSVRPGLRLQQGGRSSISLPHEGTVAEIINGLGRGALPPTGEVQGRVFLGLGRRLSL